MTELVLKPMTADEAKQCINEINSGLLAVRHRLLDLYERDGWKALGYDSWRACAMNEFNFSQTRVYELLSAAETERNISAMAENDQPIPERQLRPLASLEPETQRKAWQEAKATAPNGKLTAAHVETIVAAHKPPPPPAREYEAAVPLITPPTVLDRSLSAMDQEIAALVEPEPRQATASNGSNGHAKMAVHFSSDSPEHYTPSPIIKAAIACMGDIDLDPCSNSKTAPNVPALDHYTLTDDGLSRPWFGRIYMNPPYGRAIVEWVTKLKSEYQAGNTTEAIALVPARTDTQWFRMLDCYPCCYIEGRLTFIGNDDPAPFPSAVFYLGERMEQFYWAFRELGTIKIELDEHWFAQGE